LVSDDDDDDDVNKVDLGMLENKPCCGWVSVVVGFEEVNKLVELVNKDVDGVDDDDDDVENKFKG
jgi:hypothetical protein